jgi:hypothetical protein
MFGIALPNIFRGIAKMIMLKIAAAIVAVAIASSLLVVFAPDFSEDLALAAVACFSFS